MILFKGLAFSQENLDTLRKYEVAFDGFISASNIGGAFGVGLKYVIVQNENYAFGPSVRLQRMWSNNVNGNFGFNIYGGGAFFHYRLNNLMFIGAEFEYLKSPISYYYLTSPTTWVPTCFVGGGYSHEFTNIRIRLNAGVYYDIINNLNSPFRTSYVLKKENGTLMPVIYRVGFFFPLN